MKICIVAMTGLYPVDLGGPGSPAYFLARELNRKGIDVYLIINADRNKLNRLKDTKEFKELDKTKIISIDVKYGLKSVLNPFYVFKKIREINRELRNIIDDVDIIFYNSPPVDITLFFPFISRIKMKKQVFVLHGGLFYEGKNLIGKLLMRLQKKRFDKVIAVSNYSRDIALNFGFQPDKIEVINNGVDLKIFERLKPLDIQGNPKLLHVGALRPIKGVDVLLHAFSLFIKDCPNAHLYLVGTGEERSNLEQLSKSLDIMNNVHFEGFIPLGENVLRYYKSCDLFIMPSYKENFPLVILEAMASEIPLILSDIPGGPREMVYSGENGLLFPPGDCEALSREIKRIIENKEFREGMIFKNNLLIRKYGWDIIASKYISTFENLL